MMSPMARADACPLSAELSGRMPPFLPLAVAPAPVGQGGGFRHRFSGYCSGGCFGDRLNSRCCYCCEPLWERGLFWYCHISARFTVGQQDTRLGIPPSAPAANIADASTADASTVLRSPTPQYILIGDSMIRSVAIPNGITYSFPAAKILDLHKHIPVIVDRHLSAHTILVHCSVNKLRCRQSTKLRMEYQQLAYLIESLGRTCIFTGLIPSPRRGSEFFSRLFSINQWLSDFCSACRFGFINNLIHSGKGLIYSGWTTSTSTSKVSLL